jgi:hypothetical protein
MLDTTVILEIWLLAAGRSLLTQSAFERDARARATLAIVGGVLLAAGLWLLVQDAPRLTAAPALQ